MIKTFETFITSIKGDYVNLMLIADNEFAGYRKILVEKFLKSNIKCKKGTLLFTTAEYEPDKVMTGIMERPEFTIEGEFTRWENQAVSLKMVECIRICYEEDIKDLTGFMADRIIEYGKFEDGDTIIQRISDAHTFWWNEMKEVKKND